MATIYKIIIIITSPLEVPLAAKLPLERPLGIFKLQGDPVLLMWLCSTHCARILAP